MSGKFIIRLAARPHVTSDYNTLKFALKAAAIALKKGEAVIIEPPTE